MRTIGHVIVWAIMGAGLLTAGAGFVLIFLQCMSWLKFGTYESYSLQTVWDAMGVPWPQTVGVGLQHFIDSAMRLLLRLPLSVALMIVGFAVFFFGARLYSASGLDPYSPANLAKKRVDERTAYSRHGR